MNQGRDDPSEPLLRAQWEYLDALAGRRSAALQGRAREDDEDPLDERDALAAELRKRADALDRAQRRGDDLVLSLQAAATQLRSLQGRLDDASLGFVTPAAVATGAGEPAAEQPELAAPEEFSAGESTADPYAPAPWDPNLSQRRYPQPASPSPSAGAPAPPPPSWALPSDGVAGSDHGSTATVAAHGAPSGRPVWTAMPPSTWGESPEGGATPGREWQSEQDAHPITTAELERRRHGGGHERAGLGRLLGRWRRH